MIQKKICMVGDFAVGKTSLVRQFVHSIFSEKYMTTVGVKIDKKEILVDDTPVKLMIWDIEGEDDIMQLRLSYIMGSSGYLLVADGVRPKTLKKASDLRKKIESELGPIPFVLLLNKYDLVDQWAIENDDLKNLSIPDDRIIMSSAKTGKGVESAFSSLARLMLESA